MLGTNAKWLTGVLAEDGAACLGPGEGIDLQGLVLSSYPSCRGKEERRYPWQDHGTLPQFLSGNSQ